MSDGTARNEDRLGAVACIQVGLFNKNTLSLGISWHLILFAVGAGEGAGIRGGPPHRCRRHPVSLQFLPAGIRGQIRETERW